MSLLEKIDRRNFLQIGVSSLVVTLAGVSFLPGIDPTTCSMTPETVMGPFYPTHDRTDQDVDLTRIDGRPGQARGEIIHVRGQVLDEACNPIEGATVKIWQADAHGRYRHERDDQSVPIDPNFQGWGEAVTDEDGRYGFKTIKPAPYPVEEGSSEFRTPHIHFRVTHPDHYELITEMHFAGQPLNETDNVVQQLSEEERERTTIAPFPDENAEGAVYSFDLNLAPLKTDLVAPETLASYAGTYELHMGENIRPLQIIHEGHRLYAHVPDLTDTEIELRPLSKTRFSFEAVGDEIVFHPEEGSHGSLTLTLDSDREITASKVAEPAEEDPTTTGAASPLKKADDSS